MRSRDDGTAREIERLKGEDERKSRIIAEVGGRESRAKKGGRVITGEV